MHVMHNLYEGKFVRYGDRKPRDLSKEEIMYQTRIGGYIAERIFTLYVKHNFKKVKYLPYVKMEKDMYI